MLLRVTLQSWVRGPSVFTVAKATKTFENKAEKLSSTSTPQTNISRFFGGSSERTHEQVLSYYFYDDFVQHSAQLFYYTCTFALLLLW